MAAVTVSGLASDSDHQFIVESIRAYLNENARHKTKPMTADKGNKS
ncbi:hypothetical protein KKI43_23815 [Arthrobacter sp. GN70]|nr:hypothetical protein [Arthrobacter sp. GN70]